MPAPLRLVCLCVLLRAVATGSAALAEGLDFRRDVAPILEQHCLQCHNDARSKGDFSLSRRVTAVESGYVVPSDAEGSELLSVVTAPAGERPRMPKEGDPLSQRQVALLRDWIAAGADWPEDVRLEEPAGGDRSWWSLQPVVVSVPTLDARLRPWVRTTIDRFVAAKLLEQGLKPSPPAGRRVLIRRASYDLTGLPPAPEEVEEFVKDDSPQAWPRLVDRLLASPAYGERWGRHWLDVVRFGESNGFERNEIWNNAWPFRDYVIRAFNADKPFDQLVKEHLAGDVLAPHDVEVAIGTAFLVCGPYDDVGNQDPVQAAQIRANTIDEMVRATAESFLGLTVGCARCHNHKFDPIRQRDYYAMYATFAGVRHGSRVIASAAQQQALAEARQPLQQQVDRLTGETDDLEAAIERRAEDRAAEYAAAWSRPPVSRYGTEETFEPITARHVRLVVDNRDDNPQARTGFRIDEFEVWTDADAPRNVALASNGGTAQGTSRVAQDFAGAYGPQLTIDGRFGARWIAESPDLTITFAQPERIRRVFFSSDRAELLELHAKTNFVGDYRIEASLDGQAWREIASSRDRQPPTAAHRRQRLLDLETTGEERQRLAELRRQLTDAERELAAIPDLPSWWVGNFERAPGPFHVFVGGDPQRPGAAVVPASLSVLSEADSRYAMSGEGSESDRRLALAEWITADDNPLTARVLANRLWHYHFGRGIVASPSDFGAMGQLPTHPELLDWLAAELLRSGWSIKHLQREILLSATYQQTSEFNEEYAAIDGESRFLWRFPPQRLAAEEIRDTLLAISGHLDRQMGGPGFRLYQYLQDNVATYVPLDEHGPATYRRGVYHQNARAARTDLLTDFDCPDNSFPAPRRAVTTTPLQALTLMNHSFALAVATHLAERVAQEGGADRAAQIECLFRLAYSRSPTAEEVELALPLVETHGLRALCRAVINSSELISLD